MVKTYTMIQKPMWKKPEDLELILSCETMPEALLIEGLLKSSGINVIIMPISDSTISFVQRSVFGETARPTPYKVLVHKDDLAEAEEILTSEIEALEDDDDE